MRKLKVCVWYPLLRSILCFMHPSQNQWMKNLYYKGVDKSAVHAAPPPSESFPPTELIHDHSNTKLPPERKHKFLLQIPNQMGALPPIIRSHQETPLLALTRETQCMSYFSLAFGGLKSGLGEQMDDCPKSFTDNEVSSSSCLLPHGM